MPKLVEKQLLLEVHKPSWAAFWLTVAYTTVFLALWPAIWFTLDAGNYWLLVPLVLVQAFVMHAQLIAFHEAAHGALCPVPFINGYLGRAIGLMGFMSLTLYRAAHHWHHAYIGDRRDEEFWPLNDPNVSRGKRRLAAFFELTCGLVYTPFLFLRMFLRRDSAIRDRRTRLLIWVELTRNVVFWTVLVFLAVRYDFWLLLVFAYLIPAILAGNLQSLRKYVEHVGLTGGKVVMLTRSVRDRSWLGRAVSRLLYHEPYHDVHHLYPKVPQESLPTVADAENPVPAELPVFSSYTGAMVALCRSLSDPKFGKAWVAEEPPASPPAPEPVHTAGNPA